MIMLVTHAANYQFIAPIHLYNSPRPAGRWGKRSASVIHFHQRRAHPALTSI